MTNHSRKFISVAANPSLPNWVLPETGSQGVDSSRNEADLQLKTAVAWRKW
jgi:hypothetical protein